MENKTQLQRDSSTSNKFVAAQNIAQDLAPYFAIAGGLMLIVMVIMTVAVYKKGKKI